MDTKKKLLAGLLIVVVIGAGCVMSPGTGTLKEPVSAELEPGSIEGLAEGNNRFALDFYSQAGSEEGNIFFSPYSLSTALAMTYEGARGKTALQMKDVFYFPEDDGIRRESFLSLYKHLAGRETDHELNIANGLWAQKDFSFLREYLNVVAGYYGAEIATLDFVEKPEESRIIINKWVEEQTREKIKDLIPQGVIDHLTRMVLANAVYFKGEWVQEFDEKKTREENFHITPEESVKVDMMRRIDKKAKFPYHETETLQILEMPYSGEEISMLVLLPREHNLEEIENKLTTENLDIWRKNLDRQEVKVHFPKFKLETKYLLAPALSEMGMPAAFEMRGADFSGMTGEKGLFIDEVIHQAFVEVDEKGTEAAAATAVTMAISAVPQEDIPVFRADRPFIFLLQDKETGIILFMGRVSNPALTEVGE